MTGFNVRRKCVECGKRRKTNNDAWCKPCDIEYEIYDKWCNDIMKEAGINGYYTF